MQKHRAKVTKFRHGRDANRMLIRKLLKNFVTHGKLTTTEKKAKVLRPHIELLVHSAKKNTEATKNILKSKMNDRTTEKLLLTVVAPVFATRSSGFTVLTHLPNRGSDGASIARLTWSAPVIYKKAEPKVKKPSVAKTAETKTPAAKAVKKTA